MPSLGRYLVCFLPILSRILSGKSIGESPFRIRTKKKELYQSIIQKKMMERNCLYIVIIRWIEKSMSSFWFYVSTTIILSWSYQTGIVIYICISYSQCNLKRNVLWLYCTDTDSIDNHYFIIICPFGVLILVLDSSVRR